MGTYLNSFICICISSQSQCGHSESGKKYHNSRQNTISYISNTGATITSEHQMALALALANTEGYISQVKIQLFLTYMNNYEFNFFIVSHVSRIWHHPSGKPQQLCPIENRPVYPILSPLQPFLQIITVHIL